MIVRDPEKGCEFAQPLDDSEACQLMKSRLLGEGRFSANPDALMQVFGESVSFDMRLAVYDLKGSLGHASMLAHVGLLSPEEFQEIESGIKELFEEVQEDDFPWKLELEDVHMNLEQALRAKTEAADKPHAGRSRNDQVATDMRLFSKMPAIN